MDIRQLALRNYDKLVDRERIVDIVEFIAATPSILGHGLDFCKHITKVGLHIHEDHPSHLYAYLPRLHDYCHEGIALGAEGRCLTHFYGYAGDFARFRFQKTSNPKWANEATTDYSASVERSASDEPLWMAAQLHHHAAVNRKLYTRRPQPELLSDAHTRDIRAGTLAQIERPHFSVGCFLDAARDAQELFRATHEIKWKTTEFACYERAQEICSVHGLMELGLVARERLRRAVE